jgi:hypothetical protein
MCVFTPARQVVPFAPPITPAPAPAPVIPPADVSTRAATAGAAAQKKRTQQAGILGAGSTILTGGLGLTGPSAPAAGKRLLGQ